MNTKNNSKESVKKVSAMNALISHISENEGKSLATMPRSKPFSIVDGTERECTSFDEDSELPGLYECAMPGLLGEIVKAACKNNEVNPVAVLVALLLRICVQLSEPFFKYGGVKQYCHINIAIVGNSTKSHYATSSDAVSRIFDEMPDKAQYLEGHLQNGENIIKAIAISPSANKHKNHEYADSGICDKRLLFVETEIRNALSYAKRPGSPLLETISGLHRNGCAEVMVKSGSISVKDAHVCILAHTRCIDFPLLRNDVKQSVDLASYFLWLSVDRLNSVPRPETMTDEDVLSFNVRIENLIREANKLGELKMSKPAWEMWSDIYPGLTDAKSGLAGSVVSRVELHTIRLALFYALVAGHKQITTKDLRSAHSFVVCASESASTIFKGSLLGNMRCMILCALHTAPEKELTRTEINRVFKGNKDADKISSALEYMEKENLIESEKQTSRVGRKTTIIRLVGR